MRTPIVLPAGLAAEARAESVDDLMHRAKGCRIRPKIDSTRRAARRLHQRPRQSEVAAERLEHMLPGSHGVRIAQEHRRLRFEPPHAIRDQAILGPVSAADDIAGTDRRERRPVFEKALAKAARQQFRARLAVAVRIVSAEPVAFFEGPARAVVLIHLVAGHDDYALERLE